MSGTIDPERIASLRSLDDGSLLNELIELFFRETPARLTEIEQALEMGSADAIARAAHRIKGTSANMGANGLADIAELIESAGLDGDIAAARTASVTLRASIDEVLAEMSGLRGSS